ncbi:hypothetical protein GCM10011490_00520 [Pseudoclavibacter endophyticus]|nr:hypothetical protein GCM10011490_00520 [Pseudoclavibacter endophyticus]
MNSPRSATPAAITISAVLPIPLPEDDEGAAATGAGVVKQLRDERAFGFSPEESQRLSFLSHLTAKGIRKE